MNKHIKELARQAWEYALENNPEPYRDIDDFYVEKLIQLILLECTNIVEEKVSSSCGSNQLLDDYERGWHSGMLCARDTIKKHFGVE